MINENITRKILFNKPILNEYNKPVSERPYNSLEELINSINKILNQEPTILKENLLKAINDFNVSQTEIQHKHLLIIHILREDQSNNIKDIMLIGKLMNLYNQDEIELSIDEINSLKDKVLNSKMINLFKFQIINYLNEQYIKP